MTREEVAERLVYPLFRCLDDGYKARYVRSIWQQFEDNIRASAYTSRLSKFLENITRRLPIEIRTEYLAGIGAVIASGDDREILGWLRKETTYLTMLARLMNQERRAQMEEE